MLVYFKNLIVNVWFRPKLPDWSDNIISLKPHFRTLFIFSSSQLFSLHLSRFTPDFTSSWVIRDLTLVTERGSIFHFTPQCDSSSPHDAPVCSSGSRTQLGGVLLDHHSGLNLVSSPIYILKYHKMLPCACKCILCINIKPVSLCSSSLAGVCLMAFHQAQHILSEFFTPSPRSNHNSVPRENSSVNQISSNGVRWDSITLYYQGITHIQTYFQCLRLILLTAAL